MTELAKIRPPGRSFEDWERFLREAAPVAAYETEGTAAPLGRALWKRKRWLENAREKGLTYQDADAAWNADYERERAAIVESLQRNDTQRAAAMRERENPRSRRRADRPSAELFDRSDEGPDWTDQMHTFADDSGLAR